MFSVCYRNKFDSDLLASLSQSRMSQKSDSNSYMSSQDSDFIPCSKEEEEFLRTDNFLDGMANSVYCVKPGILKNLREFEQQSSRNKEQSYNVCNRCLPVLSILIDQFKSLKHDAKTLINRKASYPAPINKENERWRNIRAQNKWLRENIFDSFGNYIYCQQCVRSVLEVSSDRLANQREIKRSLAFSSIVEMKKCEVEEKNLRHDVILPESVSLDEYWENLDHDDYVEVQQLITTHGLQGKRSNNAKAEVMNDFIEFVDLNSQQNGRSLSTPGPHFYFLPVFSRIQMPSLSDKNYNTKLLFSVVGVFNERQKSEGKGICSNGSAVNWLKEHRPRHAIMPHLKDYCDTCKEYEQQIKALQTEINRKQQFGNSNENDLQKTLELKQNYQTTYVQHKQNAAESYRYFRQCTEACSREFAAINDIITDDPENEQLQNLRDSFKSVVTLDYQMTKVLPHWGRSAQPSASYYKLKLAVDICVAITHHDNAAYILVFDERFGPKFSSHTLSFLTFLLQTKIPEWVKHVQIFMDNAAINKNQYLGGWLTEIVQHTHFKEVRASFMDAGHTKFPPDWVMAKISKSFMINDIFSLDDLQKICKPYGCVFVLPTPGFEFPIQDWKTQLGLKYTELPGVQNLHDLRTIQQGDDYEVEVKERCDTGTWKRSPQKVKVVNLDVWPGTEHDVKPKSLAESKIKDLVCMYDRWITDEDRRLECIPPKKDLEVTNNVKKHQKQLHKYTRFN